MVKVVCVDGMAMKVIANPVAAATVWWRFERNMWRRHGTPCLRSQ